MRLTVTGETEAIMALLDKEDEVRDSLRGMGVELISINYREEEPVPIAIDILPRRVSADTFRKAHERDLSFGAKAQAAAYEKRARQNMRRLGR